jgi:hypothetical protein
MKNSIKEDWDVFGMIQRKIMWVKCAKIKERCSDIECQNLFVDIRD